MIESQTLADPNTAEPQVRTRLALAPLLAALAGAVHGANARWWHSLITGARLERNVGEMLMLVSSEIAEAMEGHRKGLSDDHLPHRSMFEVELADATIRILDLGGGLEIDLGLAIALELGERVGLAGLAGAGELEALEAGVPVVGLRLEYATAIDALVTRSAAATYNGPASNVGEELLRITRAIGRAYLEEERESGLAEALVRIFRLAHATGSNLGAALEEKMAYNAKRIDHTREARLAPGGKAY